MNEKYSLTRLVSSNFSSIGVASGGESADDDYKLASLHDGDPQTPFKSTDGSVALDIVWAGASKVRVDFMGLPIHNIAPGAAVRFQGNDTNSWGAPTMDAALTIGALLPSGHSRAPWRDLTKVTGYTSAGFNFYRLHVPINTVAVQLGEVILAASLTELPSSFKHGLKRAERQPVFHPFTTAAGSKSRYRLPILNRSVSGSIAAGDVAMVTALRSMFALGAPFVFVVDPADETDGGWLAQFSDDGAATLEWSEGEGPVYSLDIQIDELPRGLPL